MIEFAKITGKTEKPNLIEVKMRTGECLYAPITTVGANVCIPSDTWITKNKDSFLALVTFVGNVNQNPAVIGFYPVKGADSTEYNVTERMVEMFKTLLEKLGQAKVLTQLGPQQFMPDTLLDFQKMSTEIDTMMQEVNTFK